MLNSVLDMLLLNQLLMILDEGVLLRRLDDVWYKHNPPFLRQYEIKIVGIFK